MKFGLPGNLDSQELIQTITCLFPEITKNIHIGNDGKGALVLVINADIPGESVQAIINACIIKWAGIKSGKNPKKKYQQKENMTMSDEKKQENEKIDVEDNYDVAAAFSGAGQIIGKILAAVKENAKTANEKIAQLTQKAEEEVKGMRQAIQEEITGVRQAIRGELVQALENIKNLQETTAKLGDTQTQHTEAHAAFIKRVADLYRNTLADTQECQIQELEENSDES